jgi:hypothetical protein
MPPIQSQEEWVLYRLTNFYSDPNHLARVKSILDGTSDLSLRLIDWFVTNYSKKFNVGFMSKSRKYVVVYLSYKSHLKAYSKHMFDPFCRWKRIKFQDMETTVGQLNFFEWAIGDGILDYLAEHRDEVHADMEARTNKPKNSASVHKRHELSRSATNSLRHHTTPTVVRFD